MKFLFALAASALLFLTPQVSYAEPSAIDTAVETSKEVLTEVTKNNKDMLGEVADALRNAAIQHGPKAYELTIESARILAIQDFIVRAIFLLAFTVGLIYALHCFSTYSRLESGKERYRDHHYLVDSAVVGMPSFVLFLFASASLVKSIRSFVGIWNPELYIATGIVSKFIN